MKFASTILMIARRLAATSAALAGLQLVGCAAWYDDSEEIQPAYLEARQLYEGEYTSGQPLTEGYDGPYDSGDYLPPGPVTQGLADAGVYTPPHGDVTVYDDGYSLPPIGEQRYGAAVYAPAYSASTPGYYSRFGLDSSYYGLHGHAYPRYYGYPSYFSAGYGYGYRYRNDLRYRNDFRYRGIRDDTHYPRGHDRDDRPWIDRDRRGDGRIDRTPRQPPPTRIDSRRDNGRDRNARATQQMLERRGVNRTRAAERMRDTERARSTDQRRDADRARSVDRDASRGGRSNDRADRGSSRENRQASERRSDAPRREAPARSSGESGRRR